MTDVDRFDQGDTFNASEDVEVATSHMHDCPADAIYTQLDHADTMSLDVAIAKFAPLTVYAFELVKVDVEREVVSAADWFAEQAVEHFEDEYEYIDGWFTDEQQKALAEKLKPIIREFYSLPDVHHYEQIGKREYSAEQIEALLRAEMPEVSE